MCFSPPGGSSCAPVFSTYVGGVDSDDGVAIALDPVGNVYVTGDTASPDYPTTPGAYDRTLNSGVLGDAFITELDATGSELRYGSFLGGNDSDFAADLTVDIDGAVTLTGKTYSVDFPT